MKQNQMALASIGLMALCLMFSGTRLLAQSESEERGPVMLTASLAGPSTVCFGEPILLRYILKNNGDLPVSVSVADTQGDTLGTDSLTEVRRKPLIPSASLLTPRHKSNSSTLEMMDGPSLTGNGSKMWEAFANARITFPHPGSYVLRVHVERPYVAGDPQQGARYVLKRDFVFPLNVVAANPAYLRSTANQLRESILRTTDVAARATLTQALFSMPEANASSSWQALIEEPKLDGKTLNEIGTALEGLQTDRAADLLAEMLWEPVQSRDTIAEAEVYQHFYGMYDAATPAVKKHIENLHKQHGVTTAHFALE